jgi:ribonuclease BN (tRNA processing enzyme)
MNLRLVLIFGLMAVMAMAWWSAFVIYRAAELGELVAPIELREWETLTWVAVGTGSDYENPERLGPATAVAWGGQVVLVDAGRGICEALRTAKIPTWQPDIILLTNLLPQNTVGLDDLLHCGWLRGREHAPRLIGPPGTRALADGVLATHRQGAQALGQALGLPSEGSQLIVDEAEDGFELEQNGVTIRAGELPGGPLPALAWRFERGRRSIVVSGTGWAAQSLAKFAQDTDLLVHEAVYIPTREEIEDAQVLADPDRLEAEAQIHTGLESVGELATQAGAKALVLVRLRPPPFAEFQLRNVVANTYDGEILLPEDGDEISP